MQRKREGNAHKRPELAAFLLKTFNTLKNSKKRDRENSKKETIIKGASRRVIYFYK